MTDSELKTRLAVVHESIRKIYDPKTAFGNLDLIKMESEGSLIVRMLKETQQCGNCKGTGYEEHDCDCPRCDYEGDDCDACEDGRIPKTKPDEQ